MNHPDPIAIVGMGCAFPGADSPDAFWRIIVQSRDMTREVPHGRWPVEPAKLLDRNSFHPESSQTPPDRVPPDRVPPDRVPPDRVPPDRVAQARGCFVDDRSLTLDFSKLNLPESLVEALDPMFKLGLHAAGQAFAQAQTDQLDLGRVGVIIGNIVLPTEKASALARQYLGRGFAEAVLGVDQPGFFGEVHPLNRYVAGLPAGVISRALGLGGACFTLDAACASSLYALELAAAELRAGRADAMLTGGLSRPDCLYTQMGFTQLRAVSGKGLATPFDRSADGLIVGEGAGIFVLKRLADALRQGDRILGVIAGIGLSNDLDGSLLAPSAEGQLRAMRAAYQKAGWLPGSVEMIECHATGTPLGDQVELRAMAELWGEQDWRPGQCVIGSVKANIGHLLTAAGAASLMKVLLAMQHGILPRTPHFQNPPDGFDLSGGPSSGPHRLALEAEPWPQGSGPRRAAVSAFGFGGINAHVLIEGWSGEKGEPGRSNSGTGRGASAPSTSPEPASPAEIAVIGIQTQFGDWRGLEGFRQQVLGWDEGTKSDLAQPAWFGLEGASWLPGPPVVGRYVKEIQLPLGRFRIPPNECREMLPQQLLMLAVARDALDDAAVNPAQARTDAGVFVGIGLDLNTTNFQLRWMLDDWVDVWSRELGLDPAGADVNEWRENLKTSLGPALNANRTIGALGGMVASRIARECRFGGCGFTTSSEETSGLSALHAAIGALQKGDLNLALVGAVDFGGDPRAYLPERDLLCDSRADLTRIVPIEGAVALVLKRREDAERDGDRIYAFLKDPQLGSHQSGDPIVGAATGYIEVAGWSGLDEPLDSARAMPPEFEPSAWVSAVEDQIGRAGAAAGLAAVAKACLALHHRQLPPMRSRSGSTLPCHWLVNRADGPRQAALLARGVDGSQARMIIGEASFGKAVDDPLLALRAKCGLFLIGADDPDAIAESLSRLEMRVRAAPAASIGALAAGWWRTPTESGGRIRLALVAGGRDHLLTTLADALAGLRQDGENPERHPSFAAAVRRGDLTFSLGRTADPNEIAFVYPGSGCHYPGMGRELALLFPAVFEARDRQTARLRDQLRPDLFWSGLAMENLHLDQSALLIAQVALGSAVTDIGRALGIQARAAIGYSLGESAALLAMGAWSDRDGLFERTRDSQLFRADLAGSCRAARQVWGLQPEEQVNWIAGVANRSRSEIQAAIEGKQRVYLLAVNTDRECVLGGDRDVVDQAVTEMGAIFIPLHGVITVHCELLEPVAREYRDLHLFETRAPDQVRFYSGASGKSYAVTRESAADAILDQALHGVDFPKTVRAAFADGSRIFIEMGPGQATSRMIRQILGDHPHLALSLCPPQEGDAIAYFCRALARLFGEGIDLNLDPLFPSDFAIRHESQPETAADAPMIRVAVGGQPFDPPAPPRVQSPSPDPAKSNGLWSEHPSNGASRQPECRSAPGDKDFCTTPPQALVEPHDSAPWARRSNAQAAGDRVPPTNSGALEFAAGALQQFSATASAHAETHEAYLRFADQGARALGHAAQIQARLLERMAGMSDTAPFDDSFLRPVSGEDSGFQWLPDSGAVSADVPVAAVLVGKARPLFDRDKCLAFARGTIAEVLGPEFAAVDRHPTRVRLPDEPLMLVDRIMAVSGEPMTAGRVVTEHDVLAGAWYLDCGRIPTCIAVEAGQADLFLSAYLGIDFQTRGLAVYRLLDARVTFHREMPAAGEIIQYDIRIESFFRQGDTYLFRFRFDGTVDGQLLLTMRDGCAGFFSQAELDAGKGIVQPKALRQSADSVPRPAVEPLVPMAHESYSEAQIQALREGDLAGCFGSLFAGLNLVRPETLPSGMLDLVHRVTSLDPLGGRHGRGLIVAEADIHPDDWFITCHFVDDRVMPGTLMYECCLHTLRVFLLRMGWIGERGQVVCQPVPGVASRLKCRGQVLESTKTVRYEVEIKELGFRPEPYAIVDALMYADDKCIVEIGDMSLRLSGLDRAGLEALWRGGQTRPAQGFALAAVRNVHGDKPAFYDRESILAFAIGNPSEAFGEPYRVFDDARIIARLPGPPFMFLDRITRIQARPWRMEAGGVIQAQYDVPSDAWYFAENRQAEMPFAVLLEVALQPCGWLAAYMGSALTGNENLSFRNLGGEAVQLRAVTSRSGTLAIDVTVTKVSASGGMVIQDYTFAVRDRHGLVYRGTTNFGFFSRSALANQVGIRGAAIYDVGEPSGPDQASLDYPPEAPFPGAELRMVDRIEAYRADGGPHGLGMIQGSKTVDPGAWYFKAHFHQDPVIPGSLGLESMLQLLKVVAARRWGINPQSQFTTPLLDRAHSWIYRGQVIPSNQQITIQAAITAIDDPRQTLTADGWLLVDGTPIYQIKNFTLGLALPQG